MISEDALDAVMEVMESGFDPHWREAWTRIQVRESLEMPTTHLLLVDRDAQQWSKGKAAGFVLSRQALDEEELLLIAVRPEERGRGFGRQVMDLYINAAAHRGVRRIFLEMRANNPASTLYKRAGFTPVGTRPRYYRTMEGHAIDAITFARRL